jgi:hypothetical protein
MALVECGGSISADASEINVAATMVQASIWKMINDGGLSRKGLGEEESLKDLVWF